MAYLDHLLSKSKRTQKSIEEKEKEYAEKLKKQPAVFTTSDVTRKIREDSNKRR